MSMVWMAVSLVLQAPPATADISGLQVVKVNVREVSTPRGDCSCPRVR
jgi:hypothetical protein